MRCLSLILALAALAPAQSFAKPNVHQTCRIVIRQVSSSGQKDVIRFDSQLRSYKECTMLAKMHEPNFEPQKVSEKRVFFRWFR